MSGLSAFCNFVEARPRAKAVLAEWQSRLGDCFPAVAPLLRACPGLARSVPGPPPQTAPMRVVTHRDGTFVAINQDEPDIRCALRREDLILYELDATRLRSVITASLAQMKPSRGAVGVSQRRLRIGYWQPRASVQYPLDLAIVASGDTLLLTLLRCEPGAGFFATPTDRFWTQDVRTAAAGRQLHLLALDRVFQGNAADGWSATSAWDEHRDTFCESLANGLSKTHRPAARPARRAPRLIAIEQLERALEAHIRAARDHAFDRQRRDLPLKLLPRPEQRQLARQLGLSQSQVSRSLSDSRANKLHILWETAADLESVLRFR